MTAVKSGKYNEFWRDNIDWNPYFPAICWTKLIDIKAASVYCYPLIFYHYLDIEDIYVFCNFISVDLVMGKVKDLTDREEVTKAIRTAVMSKQHGNEDFLGQLIAEACSK